MKLISFALSLLLVTVTAHSKPKAYIDVDDSFFSSPKMVVDGKELSFGFLGFQDVPAALSSNTKARALAEAHVCYRNWGFGLMLAGLTGAIAYSLNTGDPGQSEFKSGTYWTLFLVGFLPGIVLQSRSQTKLVRAINEYNGVYETENQTTLELTPASNGLGFALRF